MEFLLYLLNILEETVSATPCKIIWMSLLNSPVSTTVQGSHLRAI